ncbi:MAG: DNA polymerase III subunit gamma/tau [Kiritimatiellae bacterium]|nr:DNA polymerase III subunit gamma/tau [Kiritimatiellia bacterium]
MAYEGLARKWRPQTFDDVIGQDHVARTLKNAIETGRIAHAYLFVGPRGIGKTTFARIFAKSLDCEKGPTTTPCLQCEACKEIAAGTSLDVMELDGASHNKVEDVRPIIEGVQFKPASAKYKVFIIDECHMLTPSAWNALLKTLEEPPEYVVFIFATTEGDKVLATIISRCQRFDLRRIATPLIVQRLRHICNEEKVEASEDTLLAIARGAEGGMRDALSSLDQLIAFRGSTLTEDDVLQVFGLVSRKALENLATAILTGDAKTILKLVGDFDSAGKNLHRLAVEIMEYFRNLLVYLYVGNDEEAIEATADQIAAYEKQATLTDEGRLQQIAEELTQTENKMRYTLSVRTLLEMSLIRCSRIATTASLDDILRKLNAIRTAKPAALSAPESAVAKPAFSNADLYDDPAIKTVLQEFDGKIVGVEDDGDE